VRSLLYSFCAHILNGHQRREAFEEVSIAPCRMCVSACTVLQIGLPRDKVKIPLLCVLEPFLAGNYTLVTPQVAASSFHANLCSDGY
jgi:hypothetical protein